MRKESKREEGYVWTELNSICQRNIELTEQIESLMDRLKPFMDDIRDEIKNDEAAEYECSFANELRGQSSVIHNNIQKLKAIESHLQI